MILKAKFFLLLSFVFVVSVSNAKPFQRVVVFSGGGFEFAQFLGAMEALEESDKKPDLIIASCGGAMAAAIVANFKNRELRREFIFSQRFKELLRSARPKDGAIGVSAGYSWLSRRKDEANLKLIPNLFSDYLVEAPENLPLPEMNIPFSQSSIPLIIVGAKVLFQPEQVGQAYKQKLFTEVFFTSPSIEPYLRNIKSQIGSIEDSNVNLLTEINTSAGVMQAARAAATNPMVFPPTKINHEYYVGGSVNLYPLELARELGEEVIMSYGEDFSEYSGVPAVKAAFQFDPNKRLQVVTNLYADWWTDATDRSSALEDPHGFGLKSKFLKFYFYMPTEDKAFDDDITAQMKYGRDRMREAINQSSRNHKCHMRRLNLKNSSEILLRTCGVFVGR